jgi:hypothetical protein
MKYFFLVRSLGVGVVLPLTLGLGSCSRGPETYVAVPGSAPVAASALAPVAAPPVAPATGQPSQPSAPESARPPGRPSSSVTAATVRAAQPPVAAPALASVERSGRAATYTQAGRVLDESGLPLVGATVLLRGTTKGTSTDATGGYTLEVPRGENTFLIGYAGYEDETASSHDGQPLNVTLLPLPTSKTKSRRGNR